MRLDGVVKRLPKKTCAAACLLLAVSLALLDHLSKVWALDALAYGPQPFIPGVLDFSLVLNAGAAWGMFKGARWAFIVLALAVLALILVYLVKGDGCTSLELIGLGLFLGGTIGNALDRVFRGEVVDFIHTLFISFPVFNVADCCITIGLALFIIALLLAPDSILRGDGE